MNNRFNHKKKQGVINPDNTVQINSFEGLMPDPETLRAYEELHPGCTKIWMELTQSEITSRQKNEREIVSTYRSSSLLGQILGFISSVLVIVTGAYAISLGHDVAGATIITGSAASVIAAYFIKNNQSKKNN